jgi:hypothetical protein
MVALPKFTFGGDTGVTTPEAIKRQRAVALALLGQASDTGPTDVYGGVARLGQGVISALMNRRADKQEKRGMDEANDSFNAIVGRLMGGQATPTPMGGETVNPSPYEMQGIPDPRSPEFTIKDDRQLPIIGGQQMVNGPAQQSVQPPQQQPQIEPQSEQFQAAAQEVDALPMGEIMQLMNNPYLGEGQRSVLQMVIKSKFDRGEWRSLGDGRIFNSGTGEVQDLGQKQDPVDPLTAQFKQAQIDKMKAETDKLRNPGAGARPATPEEKQQYGLPPETPLFFTTNGEPKILSGGDAMSITTNPDGTVSVVRGNGKAMTEAQSKDTVFSTRAGGALPIIDQYGNALTNLGDQALGAAPYNLGRTFQNDEYQLAEQAGLEFLQAILRKDTGAAITAEETASYGKTYLPQYGDSAALLEQKRAARNRAVAAIEAGMPPSAILAKELALRNSGQQGTPPVAPGADQPPPGWEAEWEFLTPEERAEVLGAGQ